MSTRREEGGLRKTSPKTPTSIPNYLKATASSSGDAAAKARLQGRKPVSNTDSALKSNLARRRSFDKPPPSTPPLKTRGLSPTLTFRSSSFSGKTTTISPKADPKRNGPVVTAKKSTTILRNKSETKTVSSRKQPKPNNHNVSKTGDQEKEHEHSPHVDQEDMDHKAEIQKVEEDDAEIAKVESPAVLGQHDAISESPTNMERDQELENGSCTQDKERDEEASKMDGARESHEVGSEDENAGPRLSHGKKDIALSNDVIEETARKLQKQNSRVRALAGAFETVISLQDPK